MNERLRTYGPVVLTLLLCAAVFATGALTKYPVLEAQVQAMNFPNGTRVSLENGDTYGMVPSDGPGPNLAAGTYRLKWFVESDGDNALHLSTLNGGRIEPEVVALPAGQSGGEFEFTLENAIEGLQLQFEFAAGTYMEIYDVRIYTPGCTDNAFTLLFASLIFSFIWVAARKGKLTPKFIGGVTPRRGCALCQRASPAGDAVRGRRCGISPLPNQEHRGCVAVRPIPGAAGRVYL